MLESEKKNKAIDESFIRTCPVGVRSCFDATGFYDHEDSEKNNDICEILQLFYENCGKLFYN